MDSGVPSIIREYNDKTVIGLLPRLSQAENVKFVGSNLFVDQDTLTHKRLNLQKTNVKRDSRSACSSLSNRSKVGIGMTAS